MRADIKSIEQSYRLSDASIVNFAILDLGNGSTIRVELTDADTNLIMAANSVNAPVPAAVSQPYVEDVIKSSPPTPEQTALIDWANLPDSALPRRYKIVLAQQDWPPLVPGDEIRAAITTIDASRDVATDDVITEDDSIIEDDADEDGVASL